MTASTAEVRVLTPTPTARPEDDPSTPARRVRVLVADSDPIARRVVRDALELEPRLQVVAQASDGVETVELALHYRPDYVLTEIVMPQLSGMDILQRIRAGSPEVGVIFFSSSDRPADQMAALLAGACGFFSKRYPLETVVETLSSLAHDEAAVSVELTTELVSAFRTLPRAGSGVRPILSDLTSREWETLDLISAGRTIEQIAELLGVVDDTVRSHLKHARAKLRVSTDAEVVAATDRLVRTRHLAPAARRDESVGVLRGDPVDEEPAPLAAMSG